MINLEDRTLDIRGARHLDQVAGLAVDLYMICRVRRHVQIAVDVDGPDRVAGCRFCRRSGRSILPTTWAAPASVPPALTLDIAGQLAVHRQGSAIDVRAAVGLVVAGDRKLANAGLGQRARPRQIARIFSVEALARRRPSCCWRYRPEGCSSCRRGGQPEPWCRRHSCFCR